MKGLEVHGAIRDVIERASFEGQLVTVVRG